MEKPPEHNSNIDPIDQELLESHETPPTYEELLAAVSALKQQGVEHPQDTEDERVLRLSDMSAAWQAGLELPLRGAETAEQAELIVKRVRLLLDGGYADGQTAREAVDELLAEVQLAKEKSEDSEAVVVLEASIVELEEELKKIEKSEGIPGEISKAFHEARKVSESVDISEVARVSDPIQLLTSVLIGKRYQKYLDKHPEIKAELEAARESYRPAFKAYRARINEEKKKAAEGGI